MTVSPTTTPQPDGAVDARALDQRLRSAMGEGQKKKTSRLDTFTDLKLGFAEGRFGGYPLKNDAFSAMLMVLDRLNWSVSIDQITRAMPHFPERFELLEVRECLARMGYKSKQRRLDLKRIFASHLPAIVSDGKAIFVLEAGTDGDLKILDAETGQPTRAKLSKNAKVVAFSEDVNSGETSGRRSWLAANFSKFAPEITELFGLTFVINLMVLVVSLSVMSIYDKVIPAGAYDTLAAICIGIAIALCVELTFRALKARLIGSTSSRLEYLLGSAIFGKLISLPIHMVSNTPVGDQIARLRQFETVRDLFSGPFVAVGLELPFVILFTMGLLALAGPLGLVPLALLTVFFVVGFFMIGPIKRQNEAAGRQKREQYQTALETVSNLRLLRSIGCEEVWLNRLRQKAAQSAASKRRANLSQRFLASFSASTVPIAGGATVSIGAIMVINGDLTVGMLIAATIVIWRILAPIQQMFLMLSRYTEMAQMVTQINQMMRLPSSVVESDIPVRRLFAGKVGLDRVSFRYHGATDASVQGLSVEIEPCTLVAVQGHSGSGKSTLLRLILDLYRPQAGRVTVDGVNVRQIPDTDLRATIGYVPQKPVLFHGTIAQNLRLTSPGASNAALERVCEEVGLLDSIKKQPEGINTLIDHARNKSLPGGFRQSLAIAQALLREPRILLMDEPAKTLDYDLEEALLKSIAKRRSTTTIIMVSHRPSHIRLADKVLTLDRGQMVSFEAPAPAQQRSA